ncbi:MAG: ATP-binding cassette domain-containing protein, partial [Pseudomonadota bacterium]
MDIESSQSCEPKKATSENALLRGFLDLSQTFALKVSIKERLNEISAKICRLLDLNGCLILFLTHTGHLELMAYHGLSQRYLDKGYPNDDQITMQAIESGKPIVVPNTSKDNRLQYPEEIREEGIGAIMTFPIFARDEVIGVLRLFSEQPREFSHEEVQLISTISDRIGIAFRNAEEKEQQQRQIEYLMELQSVGKIISSTRSLDEVLDLVAKAVVKILDLKGCLVRLYNPMKRTLELKMSLGLSQGYLDKGPIDARASLTEAMRGEIVEIRDAQNDERVQYREDAAREGIGSMVCAPMLLKNKVIGVLRLFTSSPRIFSQEELSFIAILTDQCAIAVENARYYENLKFEYESVLRDTQRKTILEVRELRKSFLGVEVLRGVDFVLKEGEIHGLLGENGAGKSTLIKILTGVYSRTSGRILFEGQEVRIKDTQAARSIGFSTVYQDTNLIESMSIGENIMMGSLPTYGPFRFLDRNQVRKTVQPLLQEVKLTKDTFTPVGLLTLGEKQMVMLAKILYEQKKIVILDEPTTSLTGAEIKTYFAVLRRLRSQGLTVIYISHVLDEVFETCDRITIIKDGVNVATKRVDELDKVEVSRLMVGRDIKTSFDAETQLTPEPVLKITNLVSDKLIKPFSLEVRGGEIVGVVGARGAGEEELVRLILGLGNRLQGEIFLDSLDISRWGLSKRISGGIGFVP